ncbi:MAG: hypothetical protein K2Y09_13850 [Nitrosomonas sp.]|uniref:hypothetical protein n=1 Tax=unclassified Nitrosomonas TaxID=2609265 RepID=UPI0001B134DF|nr:MULTISPECIES: hypothetical protein [unclassified Nitrosomonas]MBX9896233.1 hypothetical protein [Nitrosomonas sp.]PXW85825.1 hypothetical protein C8R34_11760 [Nitrosomonas sp. Nm84]
MQPNILKKLSISIFMLAYTIGYAQLSGADEGGAVLDPTGTVRNFTGYAQITCFDNGNGPADYLEADIIDLSAPVEHLLVNLLLLKGDRAISVSDTVSGDANPSPSIILQGGNGVYLLVVNKTDVGARQFVVDYHCKTATGIHTGTDINVKQFE